MTRPPWRPLTRRSFVAMLGAAATALAIRDRPRIADLVARNDHNDGEPPDTTWVGPTRWIGHC